MSSPQQPTGYKRRSSGKRARRSSPAAQPAVAGNGSSEVTAPAAAVTELKATTSRAKSTRGTSTTSRPRFVERIVNTKRFEGAQRYTRDAWGEIKKVIWPDRETTRNLTLVVMAVSVVLGILLGGIDYVLFQVFEAMP